MYPYVNSYKMHSRGGYDTSKFLRAKQHNEKINLNRKWRRALKKLKNFSEKEVENLFHSLSLVANSGGKKSLRDMAPYLFLSLILLGGVSAAALYMSPKPLNIKGVNVNKTYVNPGESFEIEARITDRLSLNAGVKNATANVRLPNSTVVSVPMEKVDLGMYKTDVNTTKLGGQLGEYVVNVTAFDKEEYKAVKPGPAVTSGFSQEQREGLLGSGMDEKFLDGDFAKWARDVSKKYNNSDEILPKTAEILSDIGVRSTKRRTLDGYGNCSLAELLYGYPRHSTNTLRLLYTAAERPEGLYLLDFSPAVVRGTLITNGTYDMLIPEKSNVNATELVESLKENGWISGNVDIINNHSLEIGSENIERDHWLIVENIDRDSRLAEKPEWYQALNIMAQQNGWDFFDNRKMKRYNLKPTDEAVWEIVDPLRNWLFNEDRMGYPLDLPWMTDLNDKKIAYMKLFELPTKVGDLDINLQNRTEVFYKDLDAMRYFTQRLPIEYGKISSDFPNGTYTNPYTGVKIPFINGFYGPITDRGFHGLENAMKQFLGPNIINNESIPDLDEQYINKNPDSINANLSRNFPEYYLAKYTTGYSVKKFGVDLSVTRHARKIALTAFRIPSIVTSSHYEHYISAPAGSATGEDSAILGFPDTVLRPIEEGAYGEFIILPGNGIHTILSPIEGAIKDLEYGQQNHVEPNAKYVEVYFPIRGNTIYLFRAGKKR